MKKAIKLFIAMRNIAIITLVAAIGFSMAACSDGGDSTPTTYPVTVNGGNGSGSYAAGATVSISATVPSGQTFTNWTVNSGVATLANANSASTTFTMPANAVIVTANFISSPSYSLNGVWGNSSGTAEVTVSGYNGILSSYIGTNALWLDAINKNYVTVGSSQFWRNLTSTGTLTWSGQELTVQNYTSSPNVAVGTGSVNITITMSSNGQTLTVSSDLATVTWTRKNTYSLNGVWGNSSGTAEVTVSGYNGILSSYIGTNALWLDAINKNYVTVGSSQFWRNLTSTGTLTWSGQELTVQNYTSSPNVAVGTGSVNITITMSSNGQTLTVSSDLATVTWTRK